MARIVVLLFGPSGAGKTTIARASDLQVWDRDDPPWKAQDEQAFRRAIRRLANNPAARAVVIRQGATSSARAKSIDDIAATHAFMVNPGRDVCHYRAGHRRREDAKRSHSYIDGWYKRYDLKDGVPSWPGSWEQALALPVAGLWTPRPAIHHTPRGKSKAGDPRGTQGWKRLREQVFREETHCWKCGIWVDQTLPPDHPLSRTVDHLDAIALGGAGVPDRSRVRLACRRCNGKRGAEAHPQQRSLTVTIDLI